MNEIIDKIYRYIEQNNMLTDCERVVVGLSGGADSVCLLMVLKGYIERKHLQTELCVVHVNHGIRQEAGDDEEFARVLCERMGVEFMAYHIDAAGLAKQLGIGELTLADIVKELEKPSRDPRDEMPKPILRSDVLSMEDLKPDMELKGTVRNVVDFGAFVDIGVHEDGLVHLSQLCNRYVKHPSEVVSVGDIVNVRVLSVDLKKKRIALTMKTK